MRLSFYPCVKSRQCINDRHIWRWWWSSSSVTTAPETNLWSYSLTFDHFFVCQILYHCPFRLNGISFLTLQETLCLTLTIKSSQFCSLILWKGRKSGWRSSHLVAMNEKFTKEGPEWIDWDTQWKEEDEKETMKITSNELKERLLGMKNMKNTRDKSLKRGRNRLTPTIL
jgi:hypothetical protein